MENFISQHLDSINIASNVYKSSNFAEICNILDQAYIAQRNVYVAGNGGSSSLANHFATDWIKGIAEATGKPLKTISLSANISLLTALGNDLGYARTISESVKYLGTAGDVLMLVSSSGSSPNILLAAEVARNQGMLVIGLTGFGPNPLIPLCDVGLTIETEDYQVIEDVHSMFGHLVLKYFKTRYPKHN